MEVLNTTLYKYCKMLYFWKNSPTTLGRLSNKELESIVKFIKKYPEGLLNGYNKSLYLESISYILNWRENPKDRVHNIIEDRRLKRAEIKAEALTLIIFKALKETAKKSNEKRLLTN